MGERESLNAYSNPTESQSMTWLPRNAVEAFRCLQVASTTINAGIIDPVRNRAQFFLGKRAESFDTGTIRNIALGMKYRAVGMTLRQGGRGRGAILHVANNDLVAAIHKLTGIGKANTAGRSGNDHTAHNFLFAITAT